MNQNLKYLEVSSSDDSENIYTNNIENVKFEFSHEDKIVSPEELKPEEASSMSLSQLSCNSGSDGEGDTENSLEELRRKNMNKMAALINSLRNPEMETQFESFYNKMKKSELPEKKQKIKKIRNDDYAVKFNVKIPVETRKSNRLRNAKPQYNEQDLNNIEENVRNVYLKRPHYNPDDYLVEDLEKVVYRPKRSSGASFSRKQDQTREIIPVEDVTQEMLNNIAIRVKTKVYSQNGSTCHQCRQKTLDQKTCCRNPNCTGVQGMFCGVCIKNRYGEDCIAALLNPDWTCPVCRGICNCSICRNRQGKRPTGVLTPLALQQGYHSVDHFLKDLRGEGEKPELDNHWALARESDALLGFSADGHQAITQSGNKDMLFCGICAYTDCEKEDNFLGFSDDGIVAVMGGHKFETMFGLEK